MKFIIDTIQKANEFERGLNEITKLHSDKVHKTIEDVYGNAIRNTIKPKIRGKITPRKLNKRKVMNIIRGNETWLEQNGKRITPIIKLYETRVNLWTH